MARKSNKKQQRRRRPESSQRRVKKRVCYFCQEQARVDWKDVAVLRKYMSDRAKIRARRVTGNCPRHQREVAVAVKNAREMALLPYVGNR